MSVTNIVRDDATLANRYLAGQLSEPERSAMEAALVDNPDALRELEATARLKVGLEKLRETGQLDALLRPEQTWRSPFVMSLAATLGVLVVGALLVRGMVQETASPILASAVSMLVDARGNTLPVARTFAVFRKRVEAYDAVIDLPASRQALEIRVLPETVATPPSYRVSLSRLRDNETLEPVATVEAVQPGEDGFLSVFADSSGLTPGRYRLLVLGGGSGASPDTYLIKVN
jgi:anti-sigma factor RsiW